MPAGSPAGCSPEGVGAEPCDTGVESSPVAPAPQELPSLETDMSTEADKSRGFTGRAQGARAGPPGQHMRLDDALQRALEHPKYRTTALRFEEAFIEFIQSGEQRMVIDESLTGFGKCIAHRVAKLYGLETLTVSNSENTPTVGVRRTRKSVHIPQVKLRDMYQIRHPWAPEEKPQVQCTASAASAAEQSCVMLQPAAARAAAPGTPADPPDSGHNTDMLSGAATALPAAQTYEAPAAPMEQRAGAAKAPVPQSRVLECAAQQHGTATGTLGNFPEMESTLPGAFAGAEAAAGHKETLKSLQLSRAKLDPGDAATESLTERLRPEREVQQKGQQSQKQRVSSSEDEMSHERGDLPAQSFLSASESQSQSAGSSVHQGYIAGALSLTRSSEAQESLQQLHLHAVTPITSGESLTASRSDRSEGSQLPGEAILGFRDTRNRRGSGAGRVDKSGVSLLGLGASSGETGRDMPLHEGHGRVMIPGGTHASSGTRSPASSTAGQRAGSKKGRQSAPDRGSDSSKNQPREPAGSHNRGREQLSMSDWHGDQPQGRQGRSELMQASAEVPKSPFSQDSRAAPSHAILEQQMYQRMATDPGQHVRPQLAVSEPTYLPHAQQSAMTTLLPLPPVSSGSAATPHQPGFLSPLLPNPPGQLPSGQLPGPHPPYGAFATPLNIPPGYMLVPAPGAMQGMPMYQAPLQPYPIPGHPGYYYLPPQGEAPAPAEGHMAYHSAQQGLTWDSHGPLYSHTPHPPMQAAGVHPAHARLPPGMAQHYMASPPMWPAQAAVRLPPQQQPSQAEAPRQTQQHQHWQAEQQWQMPPQRQHHQSRQQSAVSSPSASRSGNLLKQHSGEQTSRRGQGSKQQPRQQQ